MYFGSQLRKIYETDLVKNKQIENSITPEMVNASKNLIAFLFFVNDISIL